MDYTIGTIELYLGSTQADVVKIDVDAMLAINDTNLSKEFSEQAARYAYIAVMSAESEARWLTAKRQLEEVRASTDKEVRRDLANEKVTEGKVTAEMEMRRGVRDAAEYELSCREQFAVVKALTAAMDMRAQMLISMGAHARMEADQSGMHINDVKATLAGIKASHTTGR